MSTSRETEIATVSDTALRVAGYRALETRRSDSLFRDPLADRLAGERGSAMVARAPWFTRGGGSAIARTKIIDDWIIASIREGFDTVINLGAGLDTRPYRLDVPSSLQWWEADFPRLIEEKSHLLADARPNCRLARENLDLTDFAALSACLERAVSSATAAVVITEGVLRYLDPEVVAHLNRALAARPAIRRWILTLSSPTGLRMNERRRAQNGPPKFAPPDGIAYFEKSGWKVTAVDSLPHAAARFKRGPWWLRLAISLLPPKNPRQPSGRWWGVVRLEKPTACLAGSIQL